ncbi:MAG: fimbrillin family protein, partial [Mediterranea sp.]|nr:fimbrillin family protein [Mediterranea sp.]
MKQNVLLLLALAVMLGCSKSEYLSDDDANGLTIQLSSRINDTGVTRAGVVESTLPSSTLEVDIFRADMASPDGEYPDEWEEKIDGYLLTSGDITLAPIQYYLDDATQKSKFTGVYPRGGTYDPEDRTVTYTELDGATDVMCSDIAEGYKGVVGNPELTFRQLLTRIDGQLKAQDDDSEVLAEIISFYGKASSITVVGKKTGAKVTLPVPNHSGSLTDAAGAIEATGRVGDGALPLWTKAGSAPTPVLLTNAAATFGHAMFVPTPKDETETLTLTIAFEDGRTADVETPTALAYEAGKIYTITVVFEKEQLVSAELTEILDEWSEGTNTEFVTYQPNTDAPDGLSNAYLVAPGDLVVFPVSRAYTYESGAFTNTLRAYDSEGDYIDGFKTEIVWADVDATDLFKVHTVLGSGKNALVVVRAKE